MGRQPCCDKSWVKKGPWTTEEDKKLIIFIITNGHCCWRALPKLAGLRRCGKSCRLRWKNYLRPDLKRGHLSDSEEQMVIDLHAHLGNSWSKMAARLPGRTDNEIKNHWNTHVKKKLLKMGIDPVTHLPLIDQQEQQQQQQPDHEESSISRSDDGDHNHPPSQPSASPPTVNCSSIANESMYLNRICSDEQFTTSVLWPDDDPEDLSGVIDLDIDDHIGPNWEENFSPLLLECQDLGVHDYFGLDCSGNIDPTAAAADTTSTTEIP